MKIKIIGFKVGKSRPTANRTLDFMKLEKTDGDFSRAVGQAVCAILDASDFISIRRVDE